MVPGMTYIKNDILSYWYQSINSGWHTWSTPTTRLLNPGMYIPTHSMPTSHLFSLMEKKKKKTNSKSVSGGHSALPHRPFSIDFLLNSTFWKLETLNFLPSPRHAMQIKSHFRMEQGLWEKPSTSQSILISYSTHLVITLSMV